MLVLRPFPSQDLLSHRKTRLQGDLIILGDTPPPEADETLPLNPPASVLPHNSLLARYAYSQALARSTALSALEVSLENYLSSIAQLPDNLVRTGRPGLGRVALVKKLGELLKFRQGLNLNRENFYDTPDLYWAEPVLEGEFRRVPKMLVGRDVDCVQRTSIPSAMLWK